MRDAGFEPTRLSSARFERAASTSSCQSREWLVPHTGIEPAIDPGLKRARLPVPPVGRVVRAGRLELPKLPGLSRQGVPVSYEATLALKMVPPARIELATSAIPMRRSAGLSLGGMVPPLGFEPSSARYNGAASPGNASGAQEFHGAVRVDRTPGLALTRSALYRLSYDSVVLTGGAGLEAQGTDALWLRAAPPASCSGCDRDTPVAGRPIAFSHDDKQRGA